MRRTPIFRLIALGAAVIAAIACRDMVSPPISTRPQTIVLFATPKFISNFAQPDSDVAHFLDHYAPLTSRAAETIVIFAVGNSQHILTYRGANHWDDTVAWAKYTDGKKTFDQV